MIAYYTLHVPQRMIKLIHVYAAVDRRSAVSGQQKCIEPFLGGPSMTSYAR